MSRVGDLVKLMCSGHNGVLWALWTGSPHNLPNSSCTSGRPSSLDRLTNASHFSQLQWTTYIRVHFSPHNPLRILAMWVFTSRGEQL